MVQRGKKIGTAEFQVVDVIREGGNKLYIIGWLFPGRHWQQTKETVLPKSSLVISDIGVT